MTARTHIVAAALTLALLAGQAAGQSVAFSSNATIACGDTTYEGYDVTVNGCTLTVDCSHAFHSLTIINGGIVTHTAGQSAGLQLTIQTDLIINSGAAIDLTGRGDPASTGLGGGQSGTAGGGAGYGGAGSGVGPGVCWGSVLQPSGLGSGGGIDNPNSILGGSGGGSLRLIVGGMLKVDGSIRASGASPNTAGNAGAGAGGSIWITTGQFVGAGTGRIEARGGGASNGGGGGGGGRIAIYYTSSTYSGIYSTRGGANYGGGAGTIYTKAAASPRGTLRIDNEGLSAATTDWVGPAMIDADALITNRARLAAPTGAPLDLTVNGNLTVDLTGSIDMSGRGSISGQGPGAGLNGVAGGGAGYGGNGSGPNGVTTGGKPYGSLLQPTSLGSGGGRDTPNAIFGGSGGGAIKLTVAGTLTDDGLIAADGSAAGGGSNAGGGSGGSIWITAANFAGLGFVQAHGGAAANGGGGGGGGRIAVYYDNSTFNGTLRAYGGTNYGGGAGTVYTKRTSDARGLLVLDNFGLSGTTTDWVGPSPLVADVVVQGRAILSQVAGTALVMNIDGNLSVELDGSIDLSGRGSAPGLGAGAGLSGSAAGGAGYGGNGSGPNTAASGGKPYGSPTEPVDLGSGGGRDVPNAIPGGYGGGAVRLTVSGTTRLDGSLRATGNGAGGSNAGGGSGGSIWLTTHIFDGLGLVHALGGPAANGGGGGGGGRIAIYYDESTFAGILRASGGNNYGGGAGTIFTRRTADPRGQLVIDNFGLAGETTDWVGLSPVPADVFIRGQARLSQRAGQILDLHVGGDLAVESGAYIDLSGRGFGSAAGTGAGVSGTTGGGGGYGGRGGNGSSGSAGGNSYGSDSAPTDLGSGGGRDIPNAVLGGVGGGAVKLVVDGTLTVDGYVRAEGAGSGGNAGAGSGGSIWIAAGQTNGFGFILARGANASNGGGSGGGGRIAIYGAVPSPIPFTYSAAGGSGAQAGTVYFPPACYANCDGSTSAPVLNVNDFTCFLNKYAVTDPYANCDGSTNAPVLNVNDFLCFLNRYAVGCP